MQKDLERQFFNKLNSSSKEFMQTINKKVFKGLDLENANIFRNAKDQNTVLGLVSDEISDFDSVKREQKFLNEIEAIIKEELKSIYTDKDIDEAKLEARLIEKFQSLKPYLNVDMSEDFNYLSHVILRRLPASVSFQDLNYYLKSIQAKIEDMISTYNELSIKNFVKLAPSIAKLIKQSSKANEKTIRIVEICDKLIGEVQAHFYGGTTEEIKLSLRLVQQLNKLKQELTSGVYESLIRDDMAYEELEQFIYTRIPDLKNSLKSTKDTTIENRAPFTRGSEPSNPTDAKPEINENATPEISPREEKINAYINEITTFITSELDKLDDSALKIFNVTIKKEEILELAVASLDYVNEEELENITNEINSALKNYVQTRSLMNGETPKM